MDTSIFPASLFPAALVLLTFWGGDKVLSSAGAKKLYGYISQTVRKPEDSRIFSFVQNILDNNYSKKNGIFKLLRNIAIFSLVTMLVMLSVYAARQPAITEVLLTSGFLKQFFLNGFIVVFFVNLTTLVVYPYILNIISTSPLSKSFLFILFESLGKVLVFLLLTFLTWSYFAYVEDAFGGRGAKGALEAIPATLLFAIKFKNLTSVYLYSVAISSPAILILPNISII